MECHPLITTFERVDKIYKPCSQRDREQDSEKSLNFIHIIKVIGGGGGGGALHLLFFEIVYKLWFCLDFTSPKGGCGIIKHRIRKFIVSTVAIVCMPFREQRVKKKPNKLKNCAWFLK